ncbi:MAG: 50S ribosomal protein L6 [Myxococcales bacterium]|nr:50S ribosomal protein L6 [Myxococcales bacterium]
MSAETTSKPASKFVESRVGKAPVQLPAKVSVKVAGEAVTVSGPLGALTRQFKGVTFEQQQGQVLVHAVENTRSGKALHGLGRNLFRNMVQGVTLGYKREIDILGVGFKAELIGQSIKFSIGFSHPVHFVLPKGVECKIEKFTHLELTSIDKEVLGQAAANIRALRAPEPYKGKGIRYTNEKVRQKAGKSGGKGGKKK